MSGSQSELRGRPATRSARSRRVPSRLARPSAPSASSAFGKSRRSLGRDRGGAGRTPALPPERSRLLLGAGPRGGDMPLGEVSSGSPSRAGVPLRDGEVPEDRIRAPACRRGGSVVGHTKQGSSGSGHGARSTSVVPRTEQGRLDSDPRRRRDRVAAPLLVAASRPDRELVAVAVKHAVGRVEWWSMRRAQNRKPATYRCPFCGGYLPALSEHVLIAPEGDSGRRRHAHTRCVLSERRAGRLPTHEEWQDAQPQSPSKPWRWLNRVSRLLRPRNRAG